MTQLAGNNLASPLKISNTKHSPIKHKQSPNQSLNTPQTSTHPSRKTTYMDSNKDNKEVHYRYSFSANVSVKQARSTAAITTSKPTFNLLLQSSLHLQASMSHSQYSTPVTNKQLHSHKPYHLLLPFLVKFSVL